MARTKRLGVKTRPYTDRLALVARDYLDHEDEEVVIGSGASHAFIEGCLKHQAIRTGISSAMDTTLPRRQITDKTYCSPSSFRQSVPQIQDLPPPPTLTKPWNNIVANTQPAALEPTFTGPSAPEADTQRRPDARLVQARQRNVCSASNNASPAASTSSQLDQNGEITKQLSIQNTDTDTTDTSGGPHPIDPFTVPYQWLVKAHFRADKPADSKWQITACIYLQDLEAQLRSDSPEIDIHSPTTKILSRNPRDREMQLVCPWMHFRCAWTSGTQILTQEEDGHPRHLAWVCKVYFNGRRASFVDTADPMDLMTFDVLRSIEVFKVPHLLPEAVSVDEEQRLDLWMYKDVASRVPGCERTCRIGWAYSDGEDELIFYRFRPQTAGDGDSLCTAESRFETVVEMLRDGRALMNMLRVV